MDTVGLPQRTKLISISDWNSLKTVYRRLSFDSPPCEHVEAYGIKTHGLNQKLQNVEEFWRFRVAPATNRPDNTYLLDDVHPVISRIAERSYETFCNISDALDELTIASDGGAKPPRYRPCLNVLRCAGDALQLFNELIRAIGRKEGSQDATGRPSSLTKILGIDAVLFPDWETGGWEARRRTAIAYRNMLVHHGRPFTRLVRLSYLAPDITQAILEGRQPRDLTADQLLAHSRLPLAWQEQRTLLGFG